VSDRDATFDRIAAGFPPAVVERVPRPSARVFARRRKLWGFLTLLGLLAAVGLTAFTTAEHEAGIKDVVAQYSDGLNRCRDLPVADIAAGQACYGALDAEFGVGACTGFFRAGECGIRRGGLLALPGGRIAAKGKPFAPYEWSAATAVAWLATLSFFRARHRSVKAEMHASSIYAADLRTVAADIKLAENQRREAEDEARIRQMMDEIARQRGRPGHFPVEGKEPGQ